MKDYWTQREEIVKFINESGINAYDICRITKDLCSCRTCCFYVQHYSKNNTPVDFGHCTKNNRIKAVRPNTQSCGFWKLERDNNG